MKYVYSFITGKAEGSAEMKNELGGKGANLAEMCNMDLPVPPGFFTISTKVCTHYYDNKRSLPDELSAQVLDALKTVENDMGKIFGDESDPLLVSVRSGARISMPGMMETVLNVGLTTKTIPGLIAKTNNERFVYDAYRRLIMMYADVVMEKAVGIEPEEGQGIRQKLESILEEYKEKNNYTKDTDLSANDWKKISETFKEEINTTLGNEFPDDPGCVPKLAGQARSKLQTYRKPIR